MGIVIRQGLKNAAVSYVGIALGFLTTALLYPRILSAEEYGLTRVLTAFVGLVSQLAALGSVNALLKFFPAFRDESRRHNGAFFWALLLPSAGLFLAWGVLTVFRSPITGFYVEKSPLFVDYFWMAMPLIVVFLAFDVVSGYARAQFDTVFSSLLTDVGLRLGAIVLLGFAALKWLNFHQFMLFFGGMYLIRLLFMVFWAGLRHPFSFRPVRFDAMPPRRDMLAFCGFSFFSGISVFLVNNIDVLMIGHFIGLAGTAVYSIAFYVTSVISVPQNALARIGVPIISQAFQENRLDVVADVYRRSALNQSLGGGLIFLLIWGGIDTLFAFLPPDYAAGKYIILIIGLARWFDMSTGLNAGVIVTSPYYRFDLFANAVLLTLAVVTNWILIPPLGLEGAAIATAITIVLFNALRVWYVWFRMKLQPFSAPLLLNAGILGSGLLAVSWLAPDWPFSSGRVVVAAAALALAAGLMYRLGTAPDMTALIKNGLDRVYRR